MTVQPSFDRDLSPRPCWSAVGAMTMCVALLIASEFMPVSLLTPIASDLGATQGMAGQAISISGLLAVVSSLGIATVAGRFDRRHVLTALTASMLASLVLIASAPNFAVLMTARALLGIAVGGFWALATATIMRLVPRQSVSKALGLMYMGNAVATAFAAPIGSYLGGVIGWRGVFWVLVPLAWWQRSSSPSCSAPPSAVSCWTTSPLPRHSLAAQRCCCSPPACPRHRPARPFTHKRATCRRFRAAGRGSVRVSFRSFSFQLAIDECGR